jgi:hypothetical protein
MINTGVRLSTWHLQLTARRTGHSCAAVAACERGAHARFERLRCVRLASCRVLRPARYRAAQHGLRGAGLDWLVLYRRDLGQRGPDRGGLDQFGVWL